MVLVLLVKKVPLNAPTQLIQLLAHLIIIYKESYVLKNPLDPLGLLPLHQLHVWMDISKLVPQLIVHYVDQVSRPVLTITLLQTA
jgi:hypothetical protein